MSLGNFGFARQISTSFVRIIFHRVFYFNLKNLWVPSISVHPYENDDVSGWRKDHHMAWNYELYLEFNDNQREFIARQSTVLNTPFKPQHFSLFLRFVCQKRTSKGCDTRTITKRDREKRSVGKGWLIYVAGGIRWNLKWNTKRVSTHLTVRHHFWWQACEVNSSQTD